MTTTKKWDRQAIKEELLKQGKTLTGIARDAGLYDSACRAESSGPAGRVLRRLPAHSVCRSAKCFPTATTLGRHDSGDATLGQPLQHQCKKARHC